MSNIRSRFVKRGQTFILSGRIAVAQWKRYSTMSGTVRLNYTASGTTQIGLSIKMFAELLRWQDMAFLGVLLGSVSPSRTFISFINTAHQHVTRRHPKTKSTDDVERQLRKTDLASNRSGVAHCMQSVITAGCPDQVWALLPALWYLCQICKISHG